MPTCWTVQTLKWHNAEDHKIMHKFLARNSTMPYANPASDIKFDLCKSDYM